MQIRTSCLVVILLSFAPRAFSQELYVFTEPASNMPARSLSLSMAGKFAETAFVPSVRQRYMPELMLGVSKNWMIHFSGTFSDFYSNNVRWESAKVYLKWRFYSNDDVHRHFRASAFANSSYSRNPFIYQEMNLEGDTKGVQAGLIATQLLHRVAVSSSVSYLRGLYKKEELHFPNESMDNVNYSLSAGYLVFPRDYTNYRQVNLNLYCEFLGMNSFSGQHTLDIAPALQLIFNSNTKLNLGARFQLYGNMSRIAQHTYLLSLEYTILNALKKIRK